MQGKWSNFGVRIISNCGQFLGVIELWLYTVSDVLYSEAKDTGDRDGYSLI